MMTEMSAKQPVVKTTQSSAPKATAPVPSRLSIYGPQRNATQIITLLQRLQSEIGMPLFCVVQANPDDQFSSINGQLWHRIVQSAASLPKEKVALLIHSPGGDAGYSFRIAKLFQKRCGGFYAVVPFMAKSAATLMALGADGIQLGRQGELGPLDVQLSDPETETTVSGLNEVQSLERINSAALQMLDQTMLLLLTRSGKRVTTLLPCVLEFVSSFMRPMLEKLDTVHYTQTSRQLHIGTEYAKRLLETHLPEDIANKAAMALVGNYPDHDFVIDHDEAQRMKLHVEVPSDAVLDLMDETITLMYGNQNLIGLLP